MSFMPNVGSLVRLLDGRIGVVTKITPDGSDDRVYIISGSDTRISEDDIAAIIYEQ